MGYGQQKKASIVGSIAQTDAKTLQRTGGVSSLGAALTGNLPGVTTMASTGRPGDEDPKIVIRGVTSWNNSEPLVLVDGIERPMSTVDINSVQSVSVLKDASATAVYGVKGANGVILITTKRGTEGKAKIEVNMNTVMKVTSKLPEHADSYGALSVRNLAIENELGLSPDSWDKITSDRILDKYVNPSSLEEKERYPNVDWENELFNRSSMSYNPSINISGGTEQVKYFASIDYLHEGDMFKVWDNGRGYDGGYGYDRINVRSNLDFQITKTTLLKANIFGSNGQRKSPWGKTDSGSEWYETQLWQAAYSAPSDAFWPKYSDGSWGYYPADELSAPNSIMNIALAGVEKKTTTRINTDFTLEQDLSFLLKGLKASFTVSWDNQFIEVDRGINDDGNSAQQKWINPDTGEVTYKQSNNANTGFDFQEGIKWSTAAGSMDNGATQRNLYYQGQIYWGNKFGQHDISAMGVFNRTERSTGSEFTHYREDWAFRTTYNYGGRYFFEYNGAYNGSEKFSKGGIDPSFFFDKDGRGYIVNNDEPVGGHSYDGERSIKLHYFDVKGDSVVGDEIEIVRSGTHVQRNPIWIEGPHLYRIGKYYYLMCAEGGTGSWHSEVIFRAKKPEGPWEEYTEGNPILTQREGLDPSRADFVSSAGHADLVQTPKGDWYAVFLACRPYEDDFYNTGRDTYLLPVTWKDAWPTILEKDKAIPTVNDKKGLQPIENLWTGNFCYTDSFATGKLDTNRWIFLRNPSAFYSLGGNGLAIEANDANIYEKKSPSAIFARQQHTDFTAETIVVFTPSTDKELAGMVLLQNEKYNFVFGLTVVNGRKALVLDRSEGSTVRIGTAFLDDNKNEPLKLKISGHGRYYDFLYAVGDGQWQTLARGVDAVNLSTNRSDGFIGACIGLYATKSAK